MGAIMNYICDHMPSVAFFKANAEQTGDEKYAVALNELTQFSTLSLTEVNTPDFELLDLNQKVFLENAKAYTFEFDGINCAYLMLKVLSTSDDSLWLATELRQFKDSWFFDFTDVTWLSIKTKISENGLQVDELKLFPIALLTQFKDVEAQIAFGEVEVFKSKIALLRKHSNWVEHNFDPRESLSWMWTISKLGYCLSQYSTEVLIQPNSGINIKNQQLPFILENSGIQYKAMSLALQVGTEDNDDCFWLTTLFDADNQLKTQGFVISYGHYPHDLPARKLVAPNFIEESVFLKNDETALLVFEGFLKTLMIEKQLIAEYLKVLSGVMHTYLNPEFQDRMLYSCAHNEKVDASRLTLMNANDFVDYLVGCDQFVSNQNIYQNVTSFPTFMYIPNLENSIVEDIPESLKVVKEESFDGSSIYDEQQPDFNSDANRLGVMNTPSSATFDSKSYGRSHSKRMLDSSPMAMNAKNLRATKSDDIDSAIENNERKKRHNKSQPVVVHRRRWGLVAKERRDQIQQELSQGPSHNISNEDWDAFKQSVDEFNLDSLKNKSVQSNETIDVQPDLIQLEPVQSQEVEKAQVEEQVIEQVEENIDCENKVLEQNNELILQNENKEVVRVKEEIIFEKDIQNLNISLGNELTITMKPHGVKINYPKKLIQDDHNFVFNNLIALGVDPYQSRDILKSINAPLKSYSYSKVTKLVKEANIDDLKLYKGFESYIDLVERELSSRSMRKGL